MGELFLIRAAEPDVGLPSCFPTGEIITQGHCRAEYRAHDSIPIAKLMPSILASVTGCTKWPLPPLDLIRRSLMPMAGEGLGVRQDILEGHDPPTPHVHTDIDHARVPATITVGMAVQVQDVAHVAPGG